MVDALARLPDCGRDAPIAMATPVAFIHSLDPGFEILVPVAGAHHIQLVVERAARQSRRLEQSGYRVLLPEFLHYLRFFLCAPCFFA